MSYALAIGAATADPWASPGGSTWFPFSSLVSCRSMGMASDPTNPFMCHLSNGRLPVTRVPIALAPAVWWAAITCTLRGGYPRTRGLPDEFRPGDQVGCCREDAEVLCDSWI